MESKGDALMAEGEKVLSKFSFFGSSEDKADKAHDKFVQAATQYKAAGNFVKVGEAYKRAAAMSGKAKNEGEQIIELEEAAKALVKANNTAEAVDLYKDVIEMHDKNQKYVNAAKACAALAALLPPNEATPYYQRAMRYYASNGFKVAANELQVKMAEMKANAGDYEAAREAYEQLARDALDDRVSRGNARKLFFYALLAQIAMMSAASLMEDVGLLQERFDEYQELDAQFNVNTREYMVITALIDAITEDNVEMYEEAVNEYDSICPLDPLARKMLLKGKQTLRSHSSDLR